MSGAFEALGEPVRRLILELPAAGEQPAGSLVTAPRSQLPISQPAVSQHLRVLLEANPVSVRASGTRLMSPHPAASSSRIDSPYLASFDSPTPLIPASSRSVAGAATATDRSVASWKTT